MAYKVFTNTWMQVTEFNGNVTDKDFGNRIFSAVELKEALNTLFSSGKIEEIIFIQAPNIAERFGAAKNTPTEWYSEDYYPLADADTYFEKFNKGENPESEYFEEWKNQVVDAWNFTMQKEIEDAIPFNPDQVDIEYDEDVSFKLEMDAYDVNMDYYDLKFVFKRILSIVEKDVTVNIRSLNGKVDYNDFGEVWVEFTFPRIIYPMIRKY